MNTKHLKDSQHCSLSVDPDGTHSWYNNTPRVAPPGRDWGCQYHRVDENGIQDGPAVIQPDGHECWYFCDKIHRLDGPAMTTGDGSLSPGTGLYYLDGNRLLQEQWARDPRVIEYHSRTQESAEEWLVHL